MKDLAILLEEHDNAKQSQQYQKAELYLNKLLEAIRDPKRQKLAIKEIKEDTSKVTLRHRKIHSGNQDASLHPDHPFNEFWGK